VAERILEALKWHGVAMVEFKVNPQTNEWVFIEVNGRFWGSLPLAVVGALSGLFIHELPDDELEAPKPTVFGRLVDRWRLGRGIKIGAQELDPPDRAQAEPVVGDMSMLKAHLEGPVDPIDHVYTTFIKASPDRVWRAIIHQVSVIPLTPRPLRTRAPCSAGRRRPTSGRG
jgi:hypothetical protein